MANAKSFHEENTFFDDLSNPKVKWWVDSPRIRFKGFWFKPEYVKATMAIENHFKPLPSDILLASFPKTGTTWLKALTISILGHNSIPEANKQVVLLSNSNPHELVPFLEIETFGENPPKDILSTSLSESFQHSSPLFNPAGSNQEVKLSYCLHCTQSGRHVCVSLACL